MLLLQSPVKVLGGVPFHFPLAGGEVVEQLVLVLLLLEEVLLQVAEVQVVEGEGVVVAGVAVAVAGCWP